MAYFVKLTVWCDYAEDAHFLKFDEDGFCSQSDFEQMIEEEGATAAQSLAEDYEYRLFGWGFNLDEAIKSGEITQTNYDEIVNDYYADAGYSWEYISEKEYLED